ncbi:hypothetical protein [Desulforegula conservatrix]|uniref:hypothetical protein n=1 Tax=Desulforegula conservatrix TaxID=153026 RepID=UPI0004272D5D|nr:hypothetical protein [Desulforegula conservatrix]
MKKTALSMDLVAMKRRFRDYVSFDKVGKSPILVIPAQAGIQKYLKIQRCRINSGMTLKPFFDF